MSDLLKRLKKANTLDGADVIKDSKFFVDDFNDCGTPLLNVAMSGSFDRGYSHGSTLIGGMSGTFKTMFMMNLAKAHLDNHPEAFFVYYDVEFGSNQDTFVGAGLDTSRILHKPFTTIEELTHDFLNTLDALTEDDQVVFGVDSLGAVTTRKTQEDRKDKEETKRDMTGQQEMTKFWQLVNPLLNIKKFPMFAIGQLYTDPMNPYKPVFRGGQSMYYYPNNRWLISKKKIEEQVDGKKTKVGSTFTVGIEKSRLVIEDSKFGFDVYFENGMDKYTGVFDLGLQTGFIKRPTSRTYEIPSIGVTSGYRKNLETPENMQKLIEVKEFNEAVYNHYAYSGDKNKLPYEEDEVKDSPKKGRTYELKD